MATERDSAIKDLTREARRSLASADVVVPKPDHPLLLNGPELIIGSKGRLFAVFLGKAVERSRPKELLARITAVRLALPSHTICIAEESMIPGNVGHHFDQTFEFSRHTPSLTKILSERLPATVRRKEIDSVRELTFARYGAILHVQRLRDEHRFFTSPSPDTILADREPHNRSSKIKVHGDTLVGFKDTRSTRALRSALNEYTVQSFSSNYHLRDGIPESVDDGFDIAAADEMPQSRLDPEKPARVAAFSGWMFAAREELANLDNLLNDRRRLYERTLARVRILNRKGRS